MGRDQVVKHVVATLSTVLNQDLSRATEQTLLAEELALDSTSVLEVLMGLEDSLDVVIDMDELLPEALQTIGSLADHVEEGLRRAKVG